MARTVSSQSFYFAFIMMRDTRTKGVRKRTNDCKVNPRALIYTSKHNSKITEKSCFSNIFVYGILSMFPWIQIKFKSNLARFSKTMQSVYFFLKGSTL